MTARDMTNRTRRPSRWRIVVFGCLMLSGCSVPKTLVQAPPPPTITDGAFIMADGARLPYREWLPSGHPRILVLALHGIDDSRDAWERPAPILAAQGIARTPPPPPGCRRPPAR